MRMIRGWIQKFSPHFIALVVMFVAVAFTVPEAFKGKRIYHGDKVHSAGASRDVVSLHQKTGKLANWTDRNYSGMPATMVYPVYPNNLPSNILVKIVKWTHPQIVELLLLMISLYTALVVAGYNPWWSLLSALIFGLSTVNIGNIDAGHSSKVRAIATALPLLIGVYLSFSSRQIRGFLLIAGFGALNIATNHLQITYYSVLLGFILFLVLSIDLFRKKRLIEWFKSSALVAFALAIAVLPNTSVLWSNYDYAKESVRGKRILKGDEITTGLDKEYANVFSHNWLELVTTIIPRVVGGSDAERLSQSSNTYEYVVDNKVNWKLMDKEGITLPLYWGDKPLNAAPTYIGIVAAVLLLIALFKLNRLNRILFITVLMFSLFVALGTNAGLLGELMFDKIPFFNRFRAPSMILGLTAGVVAWVVAAGFSQLKKDDLLAFFQLRWFRITIGGLAICCLFFASVGPSLYSLTWNVGEEQLGMGKDDVFRNDIIALGHSEDTADGLLQAIRDDRASVMRIDAFRAIVFIGLALGLLVLYSKSKLSERVVFVSLVSLVLIDQMMVNRSYLTEDDFVKVPKFSELFPPTPALRTVDKIRSGYDRVLDLNGSTWLDAKPSYYSLSIGGNNAAKLRRYQDLIENHLDSEIAVLRSGKKNANTPALNMLNTRYVLTGFEENAYLKNVSAQGFAWFVDSIVWVDSAEEEIEKVGSLNRSKFAVVHTEYQNQLEGRISTDTAQFQMLELRYKQPGKIIYKVATDKPRLLVLSEIIYKPNSYWKSYVNDEPTDHIRANYALRAIPVPKGVHEIKFEYSAIPFEKGEPISAGGSVLWILSLIAGCFLLTRSIYQPSASTNM